MNKLKIDYWPELKGFELTRGGEEVFPRGCKIIIAKTLMKQLAKAWQDYELLQGSKT